MDINSSHLQSLRHQRYNPVETRIAEDTIDELSTRQVQGVDVTEFDNFGTKEFRDGDVADLYHENTKVTMKDPHWHQRLSTFNSSETIWLMLEHLNPDYRNEPQFELPTPDDTVSADLFDVLAERRSVRTFSGDGISAQQLSNVLWYSCNSSRIETLIGSEEEYPIARRSYPSPGGLYPTEIYLAVTNAGDELTEGLYYYVPGDHSLRVLREADSAASFNDELRSLLDPYGDSEQVDLDDANVFLLLTAAFWRVKAKYGPRGYRFIMQEAGHLLQNVLLAATALGFGGVPLGGYDERGLNEYLEIDGTNEGLVYAACLGTRTEGAA